MIINILINKILVKIISYFCRDEGEKMWKEDELLLKYELALEKCNYISFDIFDTLLLRAANNPEDIFIEVGKNAISKGYTRRNLTPYEFKEIRIISQKNAYKKNNKKSYNIKLDNEITIDDIYNEMPRKLGDLKRIMEMEIETEIEYTYLNPIIYDLIIYMKSKGKKVFLISNMYLNKKIIKDILIRNGFDYRLLEELIVSCELSLNKNSGKLFEYVLNKYNINNDDFIHIGDNFECDIQGARKANIEAIKYDLCTDTNSFIDMEKYKYGNVLPELQSLRKIIKNLTSQYSKEEKFWFEFGASVLGPILTLFCDYSIDMANIENIKTLKPFMREAVILETMLRNASEYKKYMCDVKPLYISRSSTLLPSIDKISEQVLDEIFEIKNIKLKDIIGIIGLEVNDLLSFQEYFEIYCNKINKNQIKLIIHYILKNYESKINNLIKEEKNIFIEYLKQENLCENSIVTVDLGFAGSVQEKIETILYRENIQISALHLIAFSSNKLYDKLQKGLNISCLTGIYDENIYFNDLIIDKVMLLEELMMDERGSTIGYRKINDNVEPLLDENRIPENEFQYKKVCREGMLKFQHMYYKCFSEKKFAEKLYSRKEEILNIIGRFIELPTYEESINIGKIHHEDNFGTSSLEKACKESDFQDFNNINDIDEFLEKAKYKRIMWPEAIVTLNNPTYFERKAINESIYTPKYYKEVLRMVEKLKEGNIKSIIIWGAGEVGRICVNFFQKSDVEILAVVDRKEWIHGSNIYDVEIKNPEKTSEKYRDKEVNILIASFGFVDEIKENIEKSFNKASIHTLI